MGMESSHWEDGCMRQDTGDLQQLDQYFCYQGPTHSAESFVLSQYRLTLDVFNDLAVARAGRLGHCCRQNGARPELGFDR